MTGTIFVCDDRPGGGVAAIPLQKVKHFRNVKVVRGESVEIIPLDIRRPPNRNGGTPTGDPIITLQIEEPGQPPREYPLDDWPRVVAVAVGRGQDTVTLYWLREGKWIAAEPRLDTGRARPMVEDHCFPKGYDLPRASSK